MLALSLIFLIVILNLRLIFSIFQCFMVLVLLFSLQFIFYGIIFASRLEEIK